MLLSCPCAGLDVVDTGDICSPVCLTRHLVEFGILHHHGVYNTKETLITWEDTSPSSQSVPFVKLDLI